MTLDPHSAAAQPSLTDRWLTPLTKTLLDLARPLMRVLPRGRGVVYRCLGGERPSTVWSRYGRRRARSVDHGYTMVLALENFYQRETYYQGRYEEWELQALLDHVLAPGDVFLDVGANIGMITLHAAARVQPGGSVLAFEPNPLAREHLEEHLRLNALAHVRVIPKALSFERGTLQLTMPPQDTGCGTLRPLTNRGETFPVEVARLDDYAAELPAGRTVFLKIDTEGYDFNVLKGALALLAGENVAVFAEVNPRWLKELGQTAEEMFAFMDGFGFRPFHVRLETRLLGRALKLDPLTLPGPHHWFNALFVRPTDSRFAGLI